MIMATMNPLEKKARSSFIKGLVVAGLIGVLIIAILGYFLYKMNADERARIAAQKDVLVLTREVKSGEEVTSDMLTSVKANAEVATAGALTRAAFSTMSEATDAAGNLIAIKVIAKIDIPARSILTTDMLTTEDAAVTDDLREQEYNMIVLPTSLTEGDTIDIRFKLPSGEDFIVLSKKRVKMSNLGDNYSAQTVLLNVREDEILVMSAAIVDAYQIAGSQLYANKYTEPGLQTAATATYVPSYETIQLINSDPNIVTTARNALVSRYNETYNSYRNGISSALGAVDSSTRQSQIESGVSTSTATQQSERRTYLESMYGVEY